jgi:hypothetical protein
MAAGQHNRDRRALLAAALGVPFVPSAVSVEAPGPLHRVLPGPPPRAGEDWEAALAAVRAAEARLARVESATAGYRFDEEEAVLPAFEAACDAVSGAVREAMGVAAPDWAGFSAKLELVFDYELEPHSVDEEVLAGIRADLRRLVG